MTYTRWIIALAATASLGGCGNPEPEPVTGKLTGSIAYRERVLLTPEAVVKISLQDVSLADAPARVLVEREIANPGQVPINFELEYALADVDERMSYSVRAEIRDRGGMMFTSDTHVPVLTRGGGNEAEMILVAVSRAPTVSPPAIPDAKPKGMELTGMFRYMADAALFRDCRDNKTYAVSMEGAYIDLESAYSNSGITPGEPLMVEVTGRLLERPSMEGNNNIIKLIVDSFKAIYPDKSCSPQVDESFTSTYWKLLEIEGETVVTPPGGQPAAHMIFSSQGKGVKGNFGCNNFFGTWETEDDTLRFGNMGSTRKACLHGMETEQAFMTALGMVDRYQINGKIMSFYNNKQLLAKFEAIHL